MIIKWLGHSCFLLTSGKGTAVLADPCDPETGYNIHDIPADAVTASHDHHDHCYFAAAPEDAIHITKPGSYTVKDVTIQGFETWHDGSRGALRGRNVMFLIEMDGLRVLHAGDLGHLPDEDTQRAIGRVDVLLTPVGGVYTIDYREALSLAKMLKPKVVIPMHYKTEALSFELGELAPFLKNASGCAIHRMRQSEAVLSADALGSNRIIVLDYDKN